MAKHYSQVLPNRLTAWSEKHNSTRHVDCSDFLDTLMCRMQEFAGQSLCYLCGDLNARISNIDDFISRVDFIPDRHVVDFNSNKHGEILINSNGCVLNGRNYKRNDFTFIGPQGASEVDYCIVPYEQLSMFDAFEVNLMPDMLNPVNVFDSLENLNSESDHSILSWKLTLHNYVVTKGLDTWDAYSSSYTWFDRNSITDDFHHNLSVRY